MIKREKLVNKLREIGCTFKTQTKRCYLWRKGSQRIFVPKSDLLSETYVQSVLRQCGQDEEQIKAFIGRESS